MTRYMLLCGLVVCWTFNSIHADGPRALPKGETPADWRTQPLKDLNGYFPFQVAETKRDWNRRAVALRTQMKVSLGLWPEPTREALNVVVHSKTDRGDYTVEKAYFESLPGFYVTGSLYRPVGVTGKRPAVLCPHGHWSNGRFYDAGVESVKKQIGEKGEKFLEGGRSPLQARCVQLARMGCVVFHYDMLGYADSVQLSYQLVHKFGKQRPEMNALKNWGFYSTQAEANFQHMMGLQTWNSIRAIDFLESLPDVDPKRIAVTGGSGGGTQSFVLAAVDKRPAVAVPAVMVSTAMQGGCTCENCCLLRVGTGNVEMAALISPRPLLVTAADDWTKEMPTKGFPELQAHYKLMGIPDRVSLFAAVQFKHNYNSQSRHAMYHWLNKHLEIGQKEPIEERDYKRLTTAEMGVWDSKHPKPTGGDDYERTLLRLLTNDTRKQLGALVPQDKAGLEKYCDVVGVAIDTMISRRLLKPGQVEYDQTGKSDKGDYLEILGTLDYKQDETHKEQLPIVFLYPKQASDKAVIWLDGDGKAGLYNEDGSLRGPVAKLIAKGVTILGVDLLMQGEFLKPGETYKRTRKVTNPREFAGFTFGYNSTLFARRVQDAVAAISYIRGHELAPETLCLVGVNGMGPVAIAARAQARDVVDRLVADTGGFRFGKLTDFHDVNFLPGGAKYDDLPGMLAVAAPSDVWLAGEKKVPEIVAAAYRAAGKGRGVTIYKGEQKAVVEEGVKWLLK